MSQQSVTSLTAARNLTYFRGMATLTPTDPDLQRPVTGPERLPLFPALEPASPSRWRAETPPPFQDSLLQELIESRPVKRLRRIGFLGALDHILPQNRHNRYDHSVGVARLALLYAEQRGLCPHDTRILAAAGLLHDVGHGPLSHTLEPIFRSRFGISHHKVGREIIRGRSPHGREIPAVLKRHGLDPDEIVAMIEGTHPGLQAFLFSSSINLDTIEGVIRCCSFILTKPMVLSAEAIVRAIAERDPLPTHVLDAFWLLKHQMYNMIIHHSVGLVYDGLAQAIATRNPDDLAPTDFHKTDQQLRRSHARLFKILDWARVSPGTLRRELQEDILSHEITALTRKLECDTSVELKRSTDLNERYVQTKTYRKMTIADLISEQETIPLDACLPWPLMTIHDRFPRKQIASVGSSRCRLNPLHVLPKAHLGFP